MSEVQVYLYTPKDKDRINHLETILLANNLPIEGLEHAYDDLIVLEQEGKIIGGVGLEIYESNALLRSLVIEEEHRGNGYSKLLLDKIFKRAKERGVTDVFLLTETAENLFSKIGFESYKRELVPESIKETVEFSSLCPDSAASMHLSLD